MHHKQRLESVRPKPEPGPVFVIEKVQQTRRRKRRFVIHFDNASPLEVGDSVLVRFGLHAGDSLTGEQLREIELAETEHRAKETALNYISYRPRSSREVSDHLHGKGFDRNLAIEIARRFQDLSLVNDLEFARMFVRDKLLRRPLGTTMLRQHLYTKGISDAMIDEVLKELVTPEGQVETAVGLLTKRMRAQARSLARLEPPARKKRLYEYLLRRGFEWDVVNKAIRTVEKQTGDQP